MWTARVRAFLRRLLSSRRAEQDLHDDVQGYADMLADELRASGLSAAEARRAAIAEVGGIEAVKESVRSSRAGAGLERAWRDLHAAVRSLRRSPGLAATTIVTIGLGIGVNTTLFSVVDSALFEPLPYQRSEELVSLAHESVQGSSEDISWEEIADWQQTSSLFQAVEAHSAGRPYEWRERNETVVVGTFTPGMPAMLGIVAAAGRMFTAEEARDDAPVIVIGDALWARAFDRRTDAVGSTMTLGDRRLTIVGVLPATFRYMFRSPAGIQSAWLPLSPAASAYAQRTLAVVMRLQPGLSIEAAHERASVVANRIQMQQPGKAPWSVRLFPLDETRRAGSSQLRTPMLMLLGTAGLVLLVACVNVANLLLTRGASRRAELALRVALGASRAQLIRLLLAEGIVVAALGGVAAVLLSMWTLDALVAFIPSRLAYSMFRASTPALDMRVLAFALGATAAVAVLSSIWPALSASRAALRAPVGGGQQVAGERRDHPRVHRALQSVQVGLAFVLAMTAALFATSFAAVLATDLGFNPHGLAAVMFSFPDGRYPTAEAKRAAVANALDRVRATPGVLRAAVGHTPSITMVGDMYLPGHTSQTANLAVRLVGPGYFDTAGIRLIAGRDFNPDDRAGAPLVAIIEEEGARRLFGEGPAIGRHFSGRPTGASAIPETTIVGVAASVKGTDFTRPSDRIGMYYPEAQDDMAWSYFIFRTDRELDAALTNVRAALESYDAGIRTSFIGGATDHYEQRETYATPRFYLVLVSLFAGLAVLTTSVGLYGLLAHAVSRRRREIGVRVILGAAPRQVRRMVLREALGPVAAGIALGAVASSWAAGALNSMLYGIGPHDPRALAATIGVLLATSALAVIAPARRATGTEPVHALRLE
jgi:predicted permease